MTPKWKEILKAPILERGGERWHDLEVAYEDDASDWKPSPQLPSLKRPTNLPREQVFWEGEGDIGPEGPISGARGIAKITSDDGEEYFWALEEFEIKETGKGKGEKYLLDFIDDLKKREDLDIHVIKILPFANNFWIKMLDKGHVKSISNYSYRRKTPDGKLIPRGV